MTVENHILLVEDDIELQELIENLLKKNGYFVSSANNTEEGRDLIRLFQFDLIILDVMLPNETGLDFFKNVLQNRINIPTIFLSALSSKADDKIC